MKEAPKHLLEMLFLMASISLAMSVTVGLIALPREEINWPAFITLIAVSFLVLVYIGLYAIEKIPTIPYYNEDYLKHTKKCPTCYGRGRVPEEGWYFTKDDYKDAYEQDKADAKAIEGIPDDILKAFRKEDKK